MDTSVVNIQNIGFPPYPILSSDFLHLLRKTDGSIVLSEKAQTISFSSFFETSDKLKAIEEKLKAIEIASNQLSAKFVTKSFVDSTYVSKEMLENTTPAFLTYETMESLLNKYVTENNLKEKGASARQDALRMADEMTDFVGAAMVGINQSGSSSSEVTPSSHED